MEYETIKKRKIIFVDKERAEGFMNRLRELNKNGITISDLFNSLGIANEDLYNMLYNIVVKNDNTDYFYLFVTDAIETILFNFGWNNLVDFELSEINISGTVYYWLEFPIPHFLH